MIRLNGGVKVDRIDIILSNQDRILKKFDTLEEKVTGHILASSVRFTKVESTIRLRSRIGAAVVALLPAMAGAIYFLLRFI